MYKTFLRKNYKALLNGTKGYLNKWKDITHSWNGRLNIIKMSVLPNLIFRFNKSLIKTPTKFYEGLNKLILKFI